VISYCLGLIGVMEHDDLLPRTDLGNGEHVMSYYPGLTGGLGRNDDLLPWTDWESGNM
jgi:hypothetical protein